MKNATIIAMLLLLAAAPAAAQKVNIDYDKETDFTKFKTFAWKATPEVSLAAPVTSGVSVVPSGPSGSHAMGAERSGGA